MVRETGFVVVELVELGMLLVLVVWVAQLRARGRRMAREVNDLSRTVTTVEAWAVREIRALRDAQRVDASALVVLEQIQQARAASPALALKPDDEPDERRELVAPSERAALELPALELELKDEDDDDDAQTEVWTGPPAALVEAAVHGVQATPHASRAPGRTGTTLLGFPVPLLQAQAGAPPEPDDEEEKRDTVATPAPEAAPYTPKPSDEDGDATTFFDPDQVPATRRVPLMRPPAPSAPPDRRGSEDPPEEAADSGLGPDDPTPLGYERAALVLPGFQGPTEESA